MTKISNEAAYNDDNFITDNDKVIGSDFDTLKKATKNYTFKQIRDYLMQGLTPETGGTLKFTEVVYNGVLTSPADVANALNPNRLILRYEVLVLSVNGKKYILKLQNLTIGIDTVPITDTDFIKVAGFTKLGDGTNTLKGYNVSTGDQEFYSLKSLGLDISVVGENIMIESKAGNNLGNGIQIYKGLNPTTKIHEYYNLKSNSLNISKEMSGLVETGNILFEIPTTSDTPKYYVNSGYDIGGSAVENGSPSKPYKTIENAITAYIGSGTAQNPQSINGDIIIQKGTGYNFTGTFELNTGTGSIILEENTTITSNPSGDWLCDFDNLSTAVISTLNIVLSNGSGITLNKNGFRNKGTVVNNGAFTDSKAINIFGSGLIYQDLNDNVNILYTIFESNYTTSNTFKNDSGSTINVTDTVIFSLTQQFVKNGGNSTCSFNNVIFKSGTANSNINTSIKVFDIIGGNIRLLGGQISSGSTDLRDVLFYLNKSSSIPCSLVIRDVLILGTMITLFNNSSPNNSTLEIIGLKTLYFICTNIAKSPSIIWTSCKIYNCVFESGEVDFTQVDLTGGNVYSTYNIFNGNVVENLRIFVNRSAAISNGLKKGSKFINTSGISSPTTGWIIDAVM